MAEYRAVEGADGSTLDLMAGARIWDIETTITFTEDLADARSSTEDQLWVDPAIGLRGRLVLSENWALIGRGIVGGFGVGSDSMYDLLGVAENKVGDNVALSGGYRYVSADYSEDSFVYDLEIQGPLLGAIIRF